MYGRELSLKLAANSPLAGTIANNVAVEAFFALDLRRAGELFDEARQIGERFGDASGVRWLRSQQGGHYDKRPHETAHDDPSRDSYDPADFPAILESRLP